MGMLAMSRAIGDHYLRPYVIAEPEISCVDRLPDDEVLILATDGLWDVFSSTVSAEGPGSVVSCIFSGKMA
jgi:protein phosphatase 2C